ncbi:MAG: transposase [Planctomycetota bacterium]
MASNLLQTSPIRRCHHAHDAVTTDLCGLRYHGVQDGAKVTTVGRAMGSDRRHVCRVRANAGRRSTAVPSPSLLGGDLVDPPHWGSLERFTKVLSLTDHLLAALTGMVRVGALCRHVGSSVVTPRRPETNRLVASDRRRDLLPCKKGGACVGKTKCGKGTKIMVLADGHGIPVAAEIHSASPAEVNLIESLLDGQPLPKAPARLIYDRAADSDPLRDRLESRGIDLICPHRSNRVKPARQDGRKLRRYKNRYKIERLNSWIQNFRRLVVRYEYHATIFLGFVQLACMMIVMRKL